MPFGSKDVACRIRKRPLPPPPFITAEAMNLLIYFAKIQKMFDTIGPSAEKIKQNEHFG